MFTQVRKSVRLSVYVIYDHLGMIHWGEVYDVDILPQIGSTAKTWKVAPLLTQAASTVPYTDDRSWDALGRTHTTLLHYDVFLLFKV